MTRYQYLIIHFLPSLINWPRLLLKHPRFALSLLYQRVYFFTHRSIPYVLKDAKGFSIDSPKVLNSYWSMFAERALFHKQWMEAATAQEKPVFLDIGANAGVFSHMIRGLFPQSPIRAFEPLPTMAERLRNWFSNDPNTHVYEVACSDRTETVSLYAGSPDDTTATLEHPNTANKAAIQVECARLDDLINEPKIFLMKIDVEGHEPAVIKGAKQTLQHTQFIITEAHTREHLQRLLKLLGPAWTTEKLDPVNYLLKNSTLTN